MRIQHNISAMNTHRNLQDNHSKLTKSLQKLSTGFRINRAGDDAAGLAISEKMRGQINGLNMASKNIQDGISLIQTAEGGLNEVHAILQRVRELTIQSANDTNTESDRDFIVDEVNQLFEEIDSITERTEFNKMKVLRGGGMITPPGGGGGGGSTIGNALTGTALQAAREEFVEKLFHSALESSEDYIRNFFGIDARKQAEITVKFTNESPGGAVAWVSTSMETTNGTGVAFNLVFDEADIFTEGDLWVDVDRIVAHEMVHAMMGASGMNFLAMPAWFKEGTAEYLSGARERLTQSVNMLGANSVVNAINGPTSSSHFYSAAYAATMFLDGKLRQNNMDIKDLFDALTPPENANTPIGGTGLVKGPTMDVALKQLFGNGYGEAQFKADFSSNGAAFITNFLTQGGIGSVTEVTGDANGMLVFGTPKTNEGFIADTGNTLDENDGFKYIWDSSTPFSTMNLTPYIGINAAIGANGEFTLQMGANAGDTLTFTLPTITVDALGLNNIDTKYLADYSLTLIDGAISSVSTERSKLGAIQNRLEHAFSSVTNTAENLIASESRIRDVDMADEMMQYTKQSILMQAAQIMLSQANQQPQNVLQLLA